MNRHQRDNIAVGRVLRELREDAGFSACAASRRIGMSNGVVGMYERGERELPIDSLVKLAALYRVDPGLVLDLMSMRCGRGIAA